MDEAALDILLSLGRERMGKSGVLGGPRPPNRGEGVLPDCQGATLNIRDSKRIRQTKVELMARLETGWK